ncbi:MAG: hypothetical protein HW410_1545 [Nitrosarchaeum sp.]|nr:hypothetical protein [Nitrosarchaeum sp.]
MQLGQIPFPPTIFRVLTRLQIVLLKRYNFNKIELYHLYLDESGVEGLSSNPSQKSADDDWFTSGGIIVNENNIGEFETSHSEIISEFFTKRGVTLPEGFKLHYREARQRQYPYDHLSEKEIGELASTVFNTIKKIDCKLVSASINKRTHCSKPYPYTANVRAYSLLLCLERFQYFLEENNKEGIGIYERLTRSMRNNIETDLQNLRRLTKFPFFTNLDKIKGKIRNGEPVKEKVLQFADFVVYPTHLLFYTNRKCSNRFTEIHYKYYNTKGNWKTNGCVYIQ